MPRLSLTALTIFRIKQGLTNPDAIIVDRNSANLEYRPVLVGRRRIGDFYIRRNRKLRPTWLRYFDGAVDFDGITTSTASLAALLLMKGSDAMYAVVFGYGASLLAEGVVEPRFGLRATLNAVDPEELRSIDHKRLEAISRHTRVQLSRAGTLDHFGVDISRDLLRAVTGTPRDRATFGARLSGADQLTVNADIPLHRLPAKLEDYATLASQTLYKKEFPWVDNISHVQDQVTIGELDHRLAEVLSSGEHHFWLAPPEVIDWSVTAGFKYKNAASAVVDVDLSLDRYYEMRGGPDMLDGGRRLQHDRIYHVRSDTETGSHSWSVIRCLVGELDLGGSRYVLNEGLWYRVDASFLAKLNAFCDAIPAGSVKLAAYSAKRDKREDHYNRRICKKSKHDLALLDQKFVHFPGRGKVEVCDIYSKNRVLIHVKKCWGASSLSHLFNQGYVSAELLRDEPSFRASFLEKIPAFKWGEGEDPIDPSDFEVCYAIIQKPHKPLALPFFSKLSLRTAVEQLHRLRFKVSLLGIPAS